MKRNDKILIGGALLLAAFSYLVIFWLSGEKGGQAVVFVDKEQTAAYDLGIDGSYEIQTERGRNLLVNKDGKAKMKEADCPDGLCVKQKAIDKKGETIVCLPHRVVVEIQSDQEQELDAVTK